MVNWERSVLDQYFADGGDDRFRLEHYDNIITKDSLIVEVGACTGDFTLRLANKFPCKIVALEPIKELYLQALKKVDNSRVELYPYGISVDGLYTTMTIDGPASSIDNAGTVSVDMITVDAFFDKYSFIDLLIINIEAAEYDIIDYILDLGLQSRVANFQIQFHDYFPGADLRMFNIQI